MSGSIADLHPSRVRGLRPTTKRKLARGSSYVVFVAAVLVAVSTADWGRLSEQFFNLDIALAQFPDIILIAGKNTLLFTLIAFVGGALLGATLAFMRMSTVAPYRWVATVYIEIFRGLPALLTIFGTAYAIPIAFGWRVPFGAVGAGLLGLILVAAAYMAETLRAGIEAVAKGQHEAARSLGMSKWQTMMSIIFPQALRIVVPPITNEFVLLIKDTSLLFIAGSTVLTKELTAFGRDGATMTANATPLVMAAMMYLLITIPLTRLVARWERRMARSK